MAEPEIDWDAVPYIHHDRHPSCCCTQCVSDEAEWEITCLRKYQEELEQKIDFLETYKHEAAFQAVQIAEREWLARVRELEAENQRMREALQAAVDWMIPRTNTEGEAYDKVIAALEGDECVKHHGKVI